MARDESPELDDKVRYLLDNALPRSIAQVVAKMAVNSLSTLAEATGYPKKSHSIFKPDSGRLSQPAEVKLLQLYQIPLDSNCCQAFINGTALEFERSFQALHRAFDANAYEEPALENRYAIEFTAIESDQPKPALATIDFEGSSSEDGRRFEIVLSFNCIEDDLGHGIQYGLRNARLYLTQGVGEVIEQAGLNKPVVVKREEGQLIIKAMGLNNPTAWRIESTDGVIGYFKANSPMCTIKPVEPIKNDEIELQMIIFCSDLVPFAVDDDLEGDGFSTAFALLDKANINVAKQRILERLANLPMFPGDADYKVICRVKRRVGIR